MNRPNPHRQPRPSKPARQTQRRRREVLPP